MATTKRNTLFVSGIKAGYRAADLGHEFERYGRLIRCDIPTPKAGLAARTAFAFVEYENADDAEEAYYDMHGRAVHNMTLNVQWAKISTEDTKSSKSPVIPQKSTEKGASPERPRSASPRREKVNAEPVQETKIEEDESSARLSNFHQGNGVDVDYEDD